VSVQIQCSSCGAVYSVYESTVGRRVRCPECHNLVEATVYLPPASPGKGNLATKVLDLAEQQGLLDGKAITELRRKVAESKFVVTPEAVAKVLVDHGHLTGFQARKLVAQALGAGADTPRSMPGIKKVLPPKKLPETVEMALAEDDEPPPPRKPGPSDDEIIDLEAVEPKPMPIKRGPAWKSEPAIPEPQEEEIVALEPVTELAPLAGPAPLDPLGGPLAPVPAARPRHDRPLAPSKAAKNVWDSPLLLIGGGVLGVLLIAFAVLLYALTRGTAAQLLAKADDSYRSGAYTAAFAAYETFLKKYPDNPEAGRARVFHAMAQLRQVSDDGKNPRLALQTAQELLPQIEKDEQFHLARSELSTILPDIADGFAALAGQADETSRKQEFVKLAGEAMDLVNNPTYLPATLRKEREPRIAAVLDKLKVTERSIQRDRDLAAAIDKIKTVTTQGDAAGAYQVRSQLLRSYPGLENDVQLVAAIRQVGEKERTLVSVSEPGTAAATDDPLAAGSPLILTARDGPAIGQAPPQPLFVLLEGAVYALDVASGRLLWRRYVGYETTAAPMGIATDGKTDALAIDGRRQELLRLASVDGKLIWRQALREAIAGYTLLDNQVIVTTRGGRVLQIDAASGKIARAAQLPQGATVAAAVDARPGRPARLLQLGEHSTLFALAADSLACTETVYLAHKKGAILVPPVAVFDHVLVCESPADDYSLITVLSLDEKTKRLTAVGRPFRLKGRVVTPLSTSGRRAAAMTDLGQIAVYEVDPGSGREAVRLIAGIEASESAPLIPFYAFSGNRFWTATRRRTLLEVQPALQQLTRRWSEDQGDSFVGAIQLQGETLVYVRREQGSATSLVEACNALTGQRTWTTHLAAPIAALAANAERNRVEAVTKDGRLFSVMGGEERAIKILEPTFASPQNAGESSSFDATRAAEGNTLVWTEAQGGRIFTFQPGSGETPVTTPLGAASNRAVAPAQMLGGRLVVPLSDGGVALLEKASGKQAALPFVPPLVPGELPRWTAPAIRADSSGFVISDGRGVVYAVNLKTDPQPQLVAGGEAKTNAPVVSPLVMAGGVAFGLMRSETGDALAGFDAQTAAARLPAPLQGRAMAGPFAVGGLVIIASELDGIVCFDAEPKLRWQLSPSPHGPLAGPPLATDDGDLVLIYQSGVVARVDAATGKELATTEVGQPLGSAACLLGSELFLSGSDGVIHRVSLPARP
jgi:outer membrane protein assembly factor BamB